MSSTENHERDAPDLAAIRASEIELTEGADAALKSLGPLSDPVRLSAALEILVHADRYEEAAQLIVDRPVDREWIVWATFALARVGDIQGATNLVARADDWRDRHVVRRTRLFFAEGVVQRWVEDCGGNSLLARKDWKDADIDLAQTVLEALDPLLSSVSADRKIESGLALDAVVFAVYCSHILKDEMLILKYATWLKEHTPVPLIVGELCLRRIIECPSNLAIRLRIEHAGAFQAELLAALVERELLEHAPEAFDALVSLAPTASTDVEKESVCVAIFETCGRCPQDRIDKAIEIVTDLRPDDARLASILRASKFIATENPDEAKLELEAVRDESDGVWWQAFAQYCEAINDHKGAQHAWLKASNLLPHPDVLRRSVQASLERRHFQNAVASLEKLLEAEPDVQMHMEALAWTLFQLGDYSKGAEKYEQLVTLNPDTPEYRMGLAQCLARSARTEKAIEVLAPVCDGGDAPIEAVLMQSGMLESVGRAGKGLELLEAVAADHWDDPLFVMAYMKAAHVAGEERAGGRALIRLTELRSEGKVPSELMREFTLEQLLAFGKEHRSRREELYKALVGGRMPWLFAEDILGNACTWAWKLHTQELRWASEEPLTRAAYTVYASNGFTVYANEDGRHLEPMGASAQGESVVIDLSAIVTLHQLGQLEKVADFFGKLLLPQNYGDLRIRDADRFGLHQASRETELKRICSEIDRGSVRLADPSSENLLPVNEYLNETDQHAYRLRDVTPALQDAQMTSAERIGQLRLVAHMPTAVDDEHPPLPLGSALLMDLLTLRTLAGQEIFDDVVREYSIHILREQHEEMLAELQAFARAHAAKADHDAMWKMIERMEQDAKLAWTQLADDAALDHDEEDEPDDTTNLYFDSVEIATRLDKSVIVDDRVLQVLAYNEAPASTCRAFGTDRVLIGMLEAGTCEPAETAKCYRKLMKWRYRFLVPPPSLLMEWFRESRDDPPGDALLDVAAYVHDSLRDPGLHCGLEDIDLPASMATKIVIAWSDSITTFLADVWKLDGLRDEMACRVTEWIGEELIPSCPRGLWQQDVGHNLARIEPHAVLQMAMLKFVCVDDRERANLGLRVLAEALAIDENEFLTIAAEAIHAIR